jgi:hypothetical protein
MSIPSQIFIILRQLQSFFFVGRPLWREDRFFLLYMLLALASVVFLGFECLGTRDHILLSHIWDFPFHHLLWLTGSRWRYSNLPNSVTAFTSLISTRHRLHRICSLYCCWRHCLCGSVFTKPFLRNRLHRKQLHLLLHNLAMDCLPRISLHENLVTNTLPSNGCTCNNIMVFWSCSEFLLN